MRPSASRGRGSCRAVSSLRCSSSVPRTPPKPRRPRCCGSWAPQPEGPRITPYLTYQLERAWAFDARRQERFAQVKTEADLVALQDELRQKALAIIGGLPQARQPLAARLVGSIALDGYRIDKLVFESLPGIHVSALVYVPDAPGRKPAVLVACGHSELGKAYARYQEIAVRLARRGYVVLCWDPVGQGERSQFWDPAKGKSRYNLICGEHAVLGNLATLAGTSLVRYMVWDGMRAVDYLLSRDDVDGERIAITGTSGGGFQSTWIGALDPRIHAVLPSCFPTALPMRMANRIFEDPDSDPEQDPPGLVSEGVDHPGLLLLVYPRPLHVSAAVLDFFPIEGTRKTLREVAAFYRRFGHAGHIALSEGYHTHQYSDENQLRAFAFLDRAFGRPAHAGFDPVKTLPAEALRCVPSGQVRVDLGGRSLVDVIRDDARAGARRAGTSPSSTAAPATPAWPAGPSCLSRDERRGGDRVGDGRLGSRGGRRSRPLPHPPQRRAGPADRARSSGRQRVRQAAASRRPPGEAPRRRVARGGGAPGRGLRGPELRPARARRDAPALPSELGRRSDARAGR